MQAQNPHHSPETIEVVGITQNPVARWTPVTGPETLSLLDHLKLPRESSERLLNEAVSTLGHCMPPAAPDNQETGLVIGYVQSGKTMSFTTLTALARDNGIRLIIVCTGITRNLFEQSADRLKRDLRLYDRTDRTWLFLGNPSFKSHLLQSIETALASNDDLPGMEKRTVLITVMKNGTHLDSLARLLQALNLHGIPTLLIDDEADQASLNNNVNKGTESATYRRIVGLRQLLPHHTFLQYTATPQAILLINLIDVLSPSFAEVLTPGPTYTGGQTFFESDLALVRRIPSSDIPTANQPLLNPPTSLLEAMRIFFLGVAAGLLSEHARGNRSMMVHPSRKTFKHDEYALWVQGAKHVWDDVLSAGEENLDYQDLIEDFRSAHADLAQTAGDIPGFEQLVPFLKTAIKTTIVTVANASGGKTPPIDWQQFYSHIVVGGEVLNRGYTVEGLTVTYMPRSRGTNQADTIQQRARWFGYKAGYIGYCRVYLPDAVRAAYESYVDHENRLRDQLRQYRVTGNSLQEWRRAFFLDPGLQPTRSSVIDLQYIRGGFSDDWYWPKAPHDGFDAIADNREIVDRFVEYLGSSLIPDQGHPNRTLAQMHQVALSVSLESVYEVLLTRLRVTRPGDSTRFTGLLLQVGKYLEDHSDATCTVYRMSKDRGMRSVDGNDEIPALFQGANYDRKRTPPVELYPGDEKLHEVDELTIQIHTLCVQRDGAVVADNVPTIAVWVPKVMAAHWVSQSRV